jgi:Na+-translocating ferredoxin:NAD+ oxidoreductase RnfC subunit
VNLFHTGKARLRESTEKLNKIERQTVEMAARLARLEAEIEPYLPERRHTRHRHA